MERGGFTYIMTNTSNSVLYTGVTSHLKNRVWEHKTHLHPNSFSSRYNCDKLVWFESFFFIEEAISREKQIKGWTRSKKLVLIEASNPNWIDLYEQVE